MICCLSSAPEPTQKNGTPLPIDCIMSPWSEWSECDPCLKQMVSTHCHSLLMSSNGNSIASLFRKMTMNQGAPPSEFQTEKGRQMSKRMRLTLPGNLNVAQCTKGGS